MSEGLFNFVVTFFAGWGWQAIGKVPNPVTGKVERNLELAKQIIDITEMLREKTKGNLTDAESKMLTGVIAELQLNYVDELKKEAPGGEEKKPDEKKAEDTGKTG
ncbi:MAG: DUF1844 domain-containing protein [Candidatus Omnitrophica bacterium]|nr:DUF1844 domain-containing protein [Candidatus Omnitrophota bacterium]